APARGARSGRRSSPSGGPCCPPCGRWPRSCVAPEADRVREGARLLADHLELAEVLGVLEGGPRDAGAVERRRQHRLIEERRVAEARRREDHALGPRAAHALAERAALVAALVVDGGALAGALDVGARERLDRVARRPD